MRFVDRKIFCLDEKQIEAGQLRFNLLGQLALLRKANAFDRSRGGIGATRRDIKDSDCPSRAAIKIKLKLN